jgi:hypothetical protein
MSRLGWFTVIKVVENNEKKVRELHMSLPA